MTENPWKAYSERTKDQPPRSLLVEAMPLVTSKDAALDLGPGALNDSKYLLDQGFAKVIAVNKDPLNTDPVAEARAAIFPDDRFTYTVSSFENFDFKPAMYDLINAQYALPFTSPGEFKLMMSQLVASLKPGGIFTGQFFGPEDEWNDGSNTKTFVTVEEVEKLLADCEIVHREEAKGKDPRAFGGPKKWHVLHIIARKK